MFSFSMDDIREMWGEDARMRRVVGSHYFTVHQGSNLSEANNAYAPSIEMAEALVRTIKTKDDELVDAQGRSRVPYGKAIASMAAPSKAGGGNRQSKWNGAEPTKFVPINVAASQRYRDELMDVWKERPVVQRATEWVRRQLRSIDIVLKIGRNTRAPGCFPIKYREGSTGRISAQGQLGAFFNGAWSIYEVLECNFSDDGYDLDEMQHFVVSVDSEFYPALDELYRRRIAAWAAEHHVDDEEDEEEVTVDSVGEQP